MFTPLSVEVERNDPVKTIVRIRGMLAGVSISERLFLYANLKKIDLETTVEWKQDRFLRLEQRFPYEQGDAHIQYGIPYASAGDGDIVPFLTLEGIRRGAPHCWR